MARQYIARIRRLVRDNAWRKSAWKASRASMIAAMNWKRLGILALVAFVVYFLVRSPVESATAVRNVASEIGDLANLIAVSLTTFLRTLF